MAGTLLIISDKEGIEAIKRTEQQERIREVGLIVGLIFVVALLNK